MSEKNRSDILGLPWDKESFKPDAVAQLALNSLNNVILAARKRTESGLESGVNIAKNVYSKGRDVASGAVSVGVAGLGVATGTYDNLKSLINNDEPALGDRPESRE